VGFGATAYRHAAALVVETELEARMVSEFAPRHLIHVIPPGIDLGPWAAETGAPPSLDLPPRYVLYAGRIASNKGLPTLLAAFARLPPSTRIPLVLMGHDWGERAALERQAAHLGLGKEVVWLGHVSDDRQYREVFRRASLFVLPSEWEAFGLVLLEAMAAGRPIVATEVGAVPEVLKGGRAGRLVPYGDPERLASAIRELLESPEIAQGLARQGAQRALEFGWDTAVDRHLELYQRVAG
jgi:glycosyltransferase involved in cell wall biosynthesis